MSPGCLQQLFSFRVFVCREPGRSRCAGILRTLGLLAVSVATAFGQGVITTVAGTDWIFPGDGKPATQAPLFPFPGVMGIAFANTGDLLVSDPGSQMVMRIGKDGIVHVVAGNGLTGFSGEDGPATDASLNFNVAVASDSTGNLYIADHFNNRVRKVSTAGIITTVAGNGTRGFSGDGGPAINAAVVPAALAVDGSFNLYIVDAMNQRIRKVTPAGTITTIAGTGHAGYSGDNGPATSAALNLDLWRGGIVLDQADQHLFRRPSKQLHPQDRHRRGHPYCCGERRVRLLRR